MNRVEKHIIKTNNKYYDLLDDFCFKSKNLYNQANYIVRQEFINNGKWIRYNELDKILKQEGKDFDYRNMPLAKASQQCLRLLDKNWTSFLDNELPIKENYNKSRRKHRGLFISNNRTKINADVNGSYQIIKKVFPKAFVNGIEGVGLHPFKVNLL